MRHRKKVLLVGESTRIKQFATSFASAGVIADLVENDHAALAYLRNAPEAPDGIVFIVPVYWESVGSFVDEIRKDARYARVPIVYLGDFIEANDQLFLKRQGVETLTLGPVPDAEAVRFALRVIENPASPLSDITHPPASGL
jgi:hypothetical protein